MKSTRKECKLQFADLLLDPELMKRGWGRNLDYVGGNPHGCPRDQRGGIKQEYRAPDVAGGQSGMKQEYRHDGALDVAAVGEGEGEAAAVAVEEGPEGASHPAEKKQKKKQGPKKHIVDPIPSLFQRSEASEANRAARRDNMKLKLLQTSSDLPQFEPDGQDLEFERLYILAPSMTTKNQKYPMAVTDLADLRPESIQAMKEGRLPDKPSTAAAGIR